MNLLGVDDFWTLIEASRGTADQYNWLLEQLRQRSAEEIVSFETVLSRVHAEAYSFDLLMACQIVKGYVSDDVLEDFVLWLILQGRERYLRAIEDPESICDWATHEMGGANASGEALLFVASRAFSRYGSEDEFEELVEFTPTPETEGQWPDSPDELLDRFPRLIKEFVERE